MTLLIDLIKDVEKRQISGKLNISINGLANDSRKIENGFLFFACTGTSQDGHAFIDQAIAHGAIAIVCERLPDKLVEQIAYVKVTSSTEAVGIAANAFADYPTAHMKMVGVTGTNGKSTVATLAWQLAKGLGLKAGLFSTVDVRIGDQSFKATHTTPDVIQLYERLGQMRDANCQIVFMEVSSHALHQKRTFGLEFDFAIFTNATREHLDYHGDFKSYLNAKKLLFDGLKKEATACICQDDKHANYMVQNCKARIWRYGLKGFAEISARIVENSIDGLTLNIEGTEVSFLIAGSYNAQNLLAAVAIGRWLDYTEEEILQQCSLLKGAEGRFDLIKGLNQVKAIVDYAHTPDALERLLENISTMKTKKASIITVFGCGGERDKGKRPMMGAAASKYSDIVILTSDNPRSEDADNIINDVYGGVDELRQKNTFKIRLREEAIKLACQLAKNEDVIVVAGKGHENYQEINGKKFPFSDKQVLQQYLI